MLDEHRSDSYTLDNSENPELSSFSLSSTENINDEGEGLAGKRVCKHFTDQERDGFYYGNTDFFCLKEVMV